MRFLILSDLHANRQALESVLEAAAGKYEEKVCCGDLVGYGGDPGWIVNWTRENVPFVVRGNHDKAAAGLEDLEWFNPSARASAFWTHDALDADQLRYLATLPQGPILVERFSLLHGSPVDEDEYLIQAREVDEIREYLDTDVAFFGHTHLQGGFQILRHGVRSFQAIAPHEASAVFAVEPDCRYLINPGSVGQPRDGDARAAYAIYDTSAHLIEFYRVPYDVAAAQARIRAAGLPSNLADRLSRGT